MLVSYSWCGAKFFGINIAGNLRMWLWVPFLVLAVAPCWIMLRLRDRALANHNRLDPAVIWFGHLRAATVISTATWLLWLGLVVWLDPWRKLAGALHVHNVFLRDLLHSALAVIPPAGVLVICDAIAFPIVQRIRGLDFTFRETVQD